MKKSLSLILITAFSFFLISACEKIDQYFPGNTKPAAVFEIIKSEANCPSVKINGEFLDQTTLTASSNMKVQVNVKKQGEWKLNTNTLNGFSFSGKGVFLNTGKQEIELTAKGIPVSPGNYRFSLGNTSVSPVTISVLKHNVEEEIVGEKAYFKGTIDGVDYYLEGVFGPDSVAYASGGIDTMNFGSFAPGDSYPTGNQIPGRLTLNKGYIYQYTTSTEADFKNLFRPGAYAYEIRNICVSPGSLPGVTILWGEAGVDGDTWFSASGSANQEGSSFIIVGMEDGRTKRGEYYVKVKAKFNCKLYKQGTGEMKELKNGETVSYFIRPLKR